MKKAGDLLGAFFDENVLRAARGYSELFSAWRAIVGEKIAAHSRISELEKSILLVEADHPGWIQILQTKQAGILDAAQKRFPELSISGVSFRLAKDGSRGTVQGSIGDEISDLRSAFAVEELQAPPPTQSAGDEEPYSRISDDSFKELLMRLEKSIKAGKKPR